jgi:hypothetical protein
MEKNTTFWIEKYIKNKHVNVVQIGSYDGITDDPIFNMAQRNKNWNISLLSGYNLNKLKGLQDIIVQIV